MRASLGIEPRAFPFTTDLVKNGASPPAPSRLYLKSRSADGGGFDVGQVENSQTSRDQRSSKVPGANARTSLGAPPAQDHRHTFSRHSHATSATKASAPNNDGGI